MDSGPSLREIHHYNEHLAFYKRDNRISQLVPDKAFGNQKAIPFISKLNYLLIQFGYHSIGNHKRTNALKIRQGNLAIIFQDWVKEQLFSKKLGILAIYSF